MSILTLIFLKMKMNIKVGLHSIKRKSVPFLLLHIWSGYHGEPRKEKLLIQVIASAAVTHFSLPPFVKVFFPTPLILFNTNDHGQHWKYFGKCHSQPFVVLSFQVNLNPRSGLLCVGRSPQRLDDSMILKKTTSRSQCQASRSRSLNLSTSLPLSTIFKSAHPFIHLFNRPWIFLLVSDMILIQVE